MFSGIIEDIGTIKQVTGSSLSFTSKLDDTAIKDSIAVSGICLTITDISKSSGLNLFSVDYSKETFNRTTIGRLKAGDKVNLERALKAETRLGGHMVSGHVETVGAITGIINDGNSRKFEFECSSEFEKYIVEKGSIAVDGISLTVTEVKKAGSQKVKFSIAVIPVTLKSTTLGLKRKGDAVNIETDMIAKYAVKSNEGQNKINYDLLKRTGFIQ